jgi:hypothetical protein
MGFQLKAGEQLPAVGYRLPARSGEQLPAIGYRLLRASEEISPYTQSQFVTANSLLFSLVVSKKDR